jgi:lysophospholipase L1-like esterase
MPEFDGGNDARDSSASAADADGAVDGSEQDAQRDGGRGEVDAAKGVLQIMPLGDSITNGSGGTNAGYRGLLFNLLKASARNVLFVGSSVQGSVSTTVNPLPSAQRHNEGHSSYTINEISNNLDGLDTTSFDQYGGASRDPNGGHWFDGITSGANARAPLYPDIILMMVGTNNASNPDRTAVRNQLHALMTKIITQRPNAKLVVAQITPSDRPNNVSYNADVASEVTSFRAAGKNVSMVDMYTNFPADGIGGDGTHPNDKGYAVMAQRWFDGIVAIVP